MTNEEIAADIISLIRRYAIGSALISYEARNRRAVDKLKKAHDFSKQELSWIGRIKAQGGFIKINKVFLNQLESIVSELNEYLYDDGGKTA